MRTLPRSAGTDVAAQCFLNALLRETTDWRYLPAAAADELAHIHIPLSPAQALRVPVRYFSPPSTISTVSRQRLSRAIATAVTPSHIPNWLIYFLKNHQ